MRTPSLQVLHLLAQRLDVTGDYLATGGAGSTAEDDVLTQAEFALRFDELEQAEKLFTDVLESAEDSRTRARALDGLGQLAFRRGDPRATVERLEAALDAYGGDVAAHSRLADTLGRAYAMLGDLGASVEIFDRCLAEARRRNDRLEAARFAMLLGHALIDAADFDQAQSLLEETTT